MKIRLVRIIHCLYPVDEKEYFYTVAQIMRFLGKGSVLYIIICDRVSKESDAKSGKLKRRNKILKKEILRLAKKYSIKVTFIDKCYSFYESGKAKNLKARRGIVRAVKISKRLKKQGKEVLIVFPSANRAIRPDDFHLETNKDAPLKESDMEAFLDIIGNTLFAVLVPPGTSEQEQENILSRWGKMASKKPQGRKPKVEAAGRMKNLRSELRPVAIKLKNDGMGYHEIKVTLENKYKPGKRS